MREPPEEFYGASDDAALLAKCDDRIYLWILSLTDEVRELHIALEESVKLQSHQAMLLNGYDGGERIQFKSAKEWIARLRETGTLPKPQ